MDKNKGICQLSKKEFPLYELVPISAIRGELRPFLMQRISTLDEEGYISILEFTHLRDAYIQKLFEEERAEIAQLGKTIADSIKNDEFLSKNVDAQSETKLTFGQHLADKVATFGGSWAFIGSFGGFLVIWIIANILMGQGAFDNYPFILLNLLLSCLAAIQAPIIMMSQNRQEAKDRLRSQNDYLVNLKAEFEIRQLHEKIDHLLIHQSQRLFEIQQIQIELIRQLLDKSNPTNPN